MLSRKTINLCCVVLFSFCVIITGLSLITKSSLPLLGKDLLLFTLALGGFSSFYSIFDWVWNPSIFKKYQNKIILRNVFAASAWAVAFLSPYLLFFIIIGLGLTLIAELYLYPAFQVKSCTQFALEELKNENDEKKKKIF